MTPPVTSTRSDLTLFYETMVPVEEIYAGILHNAGFTDTKITALRKRNSKKELQEFMVSARKPPCPA